ncbi:MAG: hypothetical protein QM752_05230 [Gammaproteobacteria bacterium]
MTKKLKNFVSPIDQFCQEFDETHPLSASQKAERAKYEQVYQLRDNQSLKKMVSIQHILSKT